MADSSLLSTGEEAPVTGRGHDVQSLGPSDRSDTGSDMAAGPLTEPAADSDSDSSGTGERRSVEGDDEAADGVDIRPDTVVGAAGVGAVDGDPDALFDPLEDEDEGVDSSIDEQAAQR